MSNVPDDTSGDLLNLVNVLQGADSDPSFSRGNTLGIVARPFGMAHWTPQNHTGDGWISNPKLRVLQGIRATHQPSPWMGDYGHFTVMAQAGDAGAQARDIALTPETWAAPYRPEDFTIRPDYLSVVLQPHGVRLEMAPTDRCAVYRFTFPAGLTGRVLIDAHSGVAIDAATQTITGRSKINRGGVAGDFACYFAAVFDSPFTRAYPIDSGHPVENATTHDGEHVGVAAEFGTPSSIVMRIGTSFISAEQALRNVRQEIGEHGLEEIRRQATTMWSASLNKVRVTGGTTEQRRTFYSCLYRTHLFPRPLHEFDAAGQAIHYSPYDGVVHPGVLYGDSGFWDTYRTQFPLLSILHPDKLGEMIQGFVNAFHEGGWMPQWPSPGLRAVMIGTHIDAVVADAVVKGITGFDRSAAYAGILKDATVPGDPHDRFGRVGFKEYVELGYVPSDHFDKSASRSLDYYYDDFSVAQVAAALGHADDAARLRKRALGYSAVFDSAIDFMWGKEADGTWQTGFDQYTWGGPYVEGGPWQSTWAVPHDPAGLMTLMGGQKPFVQKLDRLLLQPPTFHPGTYGGVIHEMAEMGAVDFGQYDQGNQPVHLALYLFAAAGCPAKTQYWTRRVLDKLFTPDQFPGDEDNGEMSAWYVFNALGFYPLCPGHPSYVFGSPLFPECVLSLSNGKTLTITARGNSAEKVYVNGITRDGHKHTLLGIGHTELTAGGKIEMTMALRPLERRVAAADLPFSLSPYPAPEPAADLYASTIRINCGGETAEDWVGDCFFQGGETAVRANAVNTSVAHAAPASVYQSERYGAFSYIIPLPMLPGRRAYTVRLHFAEIADNQLGRRLQTVRINGRDVLAHLDLFAAAGLNTALVHEYPEINPNQDGAIVIEVHPTPYSPDKNAKISGIEVFATA